MTYCALMGNMTKIFFFWGGRGIGSVWLCGLWFDGVRNTAEIFFIIFFMKVDLLALIPNLRRKMNRKIKEQEKVKDKCNNQHLGRLESAPNNWKNIQSEFSLITSILKIQIN